MFYSIKIQIVQEEQIQNSVYTHDFFRQQEQLESVNIIMQPMSKKRLNSTGFVIVYVKISIWFRLGKVLVWQCYVTGYIGLGLFVI